MLKVLNSPSVYTVNDTWQGTESWAFVIYNIFYSFWKNIAFPSTKPKQQQNLGNNIQGKGNERS